MCSTADRNSGFESVSDSSFCAKILVIVRNNAQKTIFLHLHSINKSAWSNFLHKRELVGFLKRRYFDQLTYTNNLL